MSPQLKYLQYSSGTDNSLDKLSKRIIALLGEHELKVPFLIQNHITHGIPFVKSIAKQFFRLSNCFDALTNSNVLAKEVQVPPQLQCLFGYNPAGQGGDKRQKPTTSAHEYAAYRETRRMRRDDGITIWGAFRHPLCKHGARVSAARRTRVGPRECGGGAPTLDSSELNNHAAHAPAGRGLFTAGLLDQVGWGG